MLTRSVSVVAFVLLLFIAGCGDDGSSPDTAPTSDGSEEAASRTTVPDISAPVTTELPSSTTGQAAQAADGDGWRPIDMVEPGQVPEGSFEILERRDDGSLVVWMSPAITQAEFDGLEVPANWIKNQSRGEGGVTDVRFFGSPGATDGEMVVEERFGHEWAHVATVTEFNVPLDDDGLLIGNTIAKEHELTYPADTPVAVLVSPDGEMYTRVTRDLQRTTDHAALPAGWSLVEHTFSEVYITRLPNPTLNIQAQNRDSFQGPVNDIELDTTTP